MGRVPLASGHGATGRYACQEGDEFVFNPECGQHLNPARGAAEHLDAIRVFHDEEVVRVVIGEDDGDRGAGQVEGEADQGLVSTPEAHPLDMVDSFDPKPSV